MAQNGTAILLAIRTALGPPAVFTVIPCQLDGEYSLSVEAIDTSCKDGADDTNMPGARSRSISVETIPASWPELVAVPAGVEAVLRSNAETGVQVVGRVMEAGVAKEEFTATITSYSISAPREGNVSVSIELQISGALVPVP